MYDSKSNSIFVMCRTDTGIEIDQWDRAGKLKDKWTFPKRVSLGQRIFRWGKYITVNLAERYEPHGGTEFQIHWLAELQKGGHYIRSDSSQKVHFSDSLDLKRARRIRENLKPLNWSLFPGLPSSNDGYIGKFRIDEVDVNAGYLCLPVAYNSDFSVITAGSTSEDRIFLARRQGKDYKTEEIGDQIRAALPQGLPPGSKNSLFAVTVSSSRTYYFFWTDTTYAGEIVELDITGNTPKVVQTIKGLLARTIEVFEMNTQGKAAKSGGLKK
ncbi:MAG: hypothetical protein ABJA67_05065 [Chthonomonadales bacterium]